jgi:prepilin-type N-terminal cleavage/methylation domain-containing protein
MQTNTKAFTLVEMLVAMAVSTIIIAATYASYDLVATQYKKNIDVAEMHTSGRAVMQMIERDVRMADFKYRDQDANVTYGPITAPLVIKDSGDKCCDEVTVIYDYYDEDSKKVERIRIRYWAESYSSNKGNRYRLYKQIDVLGRNNAILANPIIGSKDLLADFLEDLQIFNDQSSDGYTYTEHGNIPGGINVWEPSKKISGSGKIIKRIVVSEFSKKRGKYGERSYVCGLAFDPKGFLFAGACQGGGIYKIDLSTGTQTKLQSSIDKVESLAYNTKNQKLYVGHGRQGRGGIDIINPDSGKTEDKIVTPIRCSYQVSGAMAMAFYQPLNLLYIGHGSHYSYVIIDPITKQCANYPPRGYLATGIAGTRAAAGDSRGYMYLSGSGRLWAFKGRDFVTDNKILATLMHNGVGDGGSAATIGYVISGNEALVTINLTLRTRNEYGKDRQFKKKDYHGGNFTFDKNDKYKRETFSSKVTARNMAL